MNRLSDDQRDIIAGAYYDKTFSQLSDEEREELSCECDTELWHHFLEVETDPEEVISFYKALFDPLYNSKMDVFDILWSILLKLNPTGFNSAYAQILAMTGRVDELRQYLKEFDNGLPKEE